MKKKNKIAVTCKECGKEEFVFPCRAKKYKCCSIECLGKYHSKLYTKKREKICINCKKTFMVKPSHYERRKCCSYKCHCETLPEKLKKEGNPNFKNRIYDHQGYLLDENNHCKKAHREICRNILGIDKLPKEFDVHHRDCNKTNNTPDNLVLLSKSSHRWLHKQFGNATLRAFVDEKISLKTLIEWSDNKEKAAKLLNLTCIEQSVVIKQGELLENLT